MSIWFALADDGELHNLCDCGDFEAAEESAKDMGINPIWTFDEFIAINWLNTIAKGVSMNGKLKVTNVELGEESAGDDDRVWIRINDLFDVKLVKTDEGLLADIFAVSQMEELADPIATTYAFDAEATENEEDKS